MWRWEFVRAAGATDAALWQLCQGGLVPARLQDGEALK
jgi:hypothetical protein